MRKTNPSFLNGVPELLVLRLLARREMYGYQIVEEIRKQTGEALSFGEGCIYPYLHHFPRGMRKQRLERGSQVVS